MDSNVMKREGERKKEERNRGEGTWRKRGGMKGGRETEGGRVTVYGSDCVRVCVCVSALAKNLNNINYDTPYNGSLAD